MPRRRARPEKLFAFAASAFILRSPHVTVSGSYTQTTGVVSAPDAEAARAKVRADLLADGQYRPPAYGELCVSVCEISAAICAAFAG